MGINNLPKIINPCSRYFCKCVEYLNFSQKKDIKTYNVCYHLSLKNKEYRISQWEKIVRKIELENH